MPYADTNRGRISIRPEVTFDTNPGGNYQILRVTQGEFNTKKDTVASNEIRSTRDVANLAMTASATEGSIGFELSGGSSYDALIEAALCGTFGTATAVTNVAVTLTTTFGVAGIDTNIAVGQWVLAYGFTNAANNGWHRVTAKASGTITVASTLVNETAAASKGIKAKTIKNGVVKRSFSVEEAYLDVNDFFLYTGQRVGTMSLEASAGQIVTGSFGFMGATSAVNTSTYAGTPVAATTTQILNATTNIGSVMEGTTLAPLTTGLQGFSMNLDNSLRAQMAIGSRFPREIGYGRQVITGSINAYFSDLSLYQKFIDHTATALMLSFTDGVGGGVRIFLPKVYFTTDARGLGGIDQDVMEKIDFAAVYDTTADGQIVMDVA
jgi:hypothetical protein